jgi:hypothetical protein
LEIDEEDYSYSPGLGGAGSQASLLNIEYDCHGSCDNQAWLYKGVVHLGNQAGYEYGKYVAPNDPDFITAQSTSSQTGGQGDGNVQTGGQGDGNVQTGGQGDGFVPATLTCGGEGCIENPLGDGSTLPAFIQSLLGIIVRAGIPLVVLALIYTGFRFVEARGNPEKITKAKHLLLYTLIGSAVVLGAWTIATILTNTINLIIS